ncbi:hypothetical protein MBLNU457_4674t1 [Dothideomycetes sp. NU457]
MAIKRKRSSATFSPVSDSSISSTFTHESSSPTRIPSFYTQIKPMSTSHSSNEWKNMDETISDNINSRTMKRHRDNRPDENQVYQTTMHKLFDAQRRQTPSKASPVSAQEQSHTRASEQPQRSTLYTFWQLPPNQMISHTQGQETRSHNLTCEGCDGQIRLQDAMEMDDMAANDETACFAMSYGVFQEYYNTHWPLSGKPGATGVIGTTFNGVIYLLMPVLFSLFTRRWAHRRQRASLCGAMLSCASILLSSYSTQVWHLIATQGVMAALGKNRALAYGIVLSSKNVVGSVCPFLFRGLLDHLSFQNAIRVWMGIVALTTLPAILMVPPHPSAITAERRRERRLPWQFLRHQTIHIYNIAIVLQSCGYGIPQTYINQYGHEVVKLSQTSTTLMLTLFNIPGIVSSSFFGYLSNKKRFSLSVTTVTSISAVSAALAAFILWGLAVRRSIALLVLFSIIFGFFAGGYSATWGGIIDELEREAARNNEAIDAGFCYGLLNGARGIGYVTGGLAGLPLLNAGSSTVVGRFGYSTTYGPLILFTGLTSVFGAFGMFAKISRLLVF